MSAQAKDLLQKIIVKDPLSRLSLNEVIAHPWIVNNTGKRPEDDAPIVSITPVLLDTFLGAPSTQFIYSSHCCC